MKLASSLGRTRGDAFRLAALTDQRTRVAALAALLFAFGLAYRGSFIAQGFNATDEGWLLSLAYRITLGQIPYRDFYYHLPPFSIYKEALPLALLGDSYTVLASRWLFAAEASLMSVAAFLVLRRFAPAAVAWLLCLPTLFFSVLLYYFSNYTYDGELLLLASLAVLVSGWGRRWSGAGAAGALAGLAFLAKPPFGLFVPAIVVLALAGARLDPGGRTAALAGLRAAWPAFLAGFGAVFLLTFAYFVAQGAAAPFLYDSFVLAEVAHPQPPAYLLVQDLPAQLATPLGVLALVQASLLGVMLAARALPVRLVAAATLFASLIALVAIRHTGELAYIATLLLLLAVNLAGAVAGLVLRLPWAERRPRLWALREQLPAWELPALAFLLQYLSQFTHTGISLSNVGAGLSVPVALLLVLRAGAALRPAAGAWLAPVTASVLALWLACLSALVLYSFPYRDGPRDRMTATFSSPKLSGVSSVPLHTSEMDGAVEAVNAYSKPGDRILVLVDYPILYYLTDRTPATRQTWFFSEITTPEIAAEALAEIQREPPRVVIVERLEPVALTPIDYSRHPAGPVRDYVVARYRLVEGLQTLDVYVP